MYQKVLNTNLVTINGQLRSCRFSDFFKDEILSTMNNDFLYRRKTEDRSFQATQIAAGLIVDEELHFNLAQLMSVNVTTDIMYGQTVRISIQQLHGDESFDLVFHPANYKVINLVTAITVDGCLLSDSNCPDDAFNSATSLNLIYDIEDKQPYLFNSNSEALAEAAELQHQLGNSYFVATKRINTELEEGCGYAK